VLSSLSRARNILLTLFNLYHQYSFPNPELRIFYSYDIVLIVARGLLMLKVLYKFDVHVTVHRDKFLIIKPTWCTNFSILFLEWNSTCFGQFLCPSSGGFHCTHNNGIYHTSLLTACEQDQDGTVLCVQWKTPDDGQRNYPKYVEFHSKNKFEKLVHLVGLVIRNYCTKCKL